jgi:hypothetical protein
MAKPKKVLAICLKVSDGFNSVLTENGEFVSRYQGYVPKFFPNEHYGDYVELDIDIDTGQILNWKRPTLIELKQLDHDS